MLGRTLKDLKTVYVVFVIIVAGTIIVLIQATSIRTNEPVSNMKKRVLPSEDFEGYSPCADVLIVVKENTKIRLPDHNCGIRKTYFICPNSVITDTINLQRSYNCMANAMQNTSSEFKGYLYLEHPQELLGNNTKRLDNDRNQIWYAKRNNTKYSTKKLKNVDVAVVRCPEIIKDIAMVNYYFRSYEHRCSGTCHRPWDSEMVFNALLWNGKGRISCFQEYIQAFYIPGKYKSAFLALASIFRKYEFNDDVAVPTILRSLDLESTFIHI